MKGQNMMSYEAKQMMIIALEYILTVGIDEALEKLKVTKDDVENYPHVREALEERDLL